MFNTGRKLIRLSILVASCIVITGFWGRNLINQQTVSAVQDPEINNVTCKVSLITSLGNDGMWDLACENVDDPQETMILRGNINDSSGPIYFNMAIAAIQSPLLKVSIQFDSSANKCDATTPCYDIMGMTLLQTFEHLNQP